MPATTRIGIDDPRIAIPSFIPLEKRAAIFGGNARGFYRL